jgi:hypothetical protein
MMRRRAVVVLSMLGLALPAAGASAAKAPPWVDNCTALNRKYPHGVGKVGARDKTSGDPVRTFRRSNVLYATAMRWNRTLDRDKDGIACEQA